MPSEVASVRAFVRDCRRPSRRRLRVLDAYVIGFGVVVGSLILAGPVGRALERLGADPGELARADSLVWLSALVGAGLGVYGLLLSLGPIVVSPAEARWLVLSPLARRAVLTRPAVVVLVLCLVSGAILGGLAVVLLGAHGSLLLGAVAGAAIAVAGGALATIAQPLDAAAALLRGVSHVGVLLAAAAVCAAMLVPSLARWTGWSVVTGPAELTAVTTASVVNAGLLTWVAWRRLANFPAPALTDAAERLGARTDAVVGLEPRAFLRIGERRYWHGRRLVSRRWPGSRRWLRLPAPFVVAWQEWRVLSRRPGRLLLLAAAVPMPAVLAATGSPGAPVAVVAGGAVAALAAVSGTRQEADHPGLTRWFGCTPGAILAARSLLPTWLSGLWTAAAVVMSHGNELWWLGFAVGPALAAGALRMARRRPIAHTSTLVVFPMSGSWIPIGWIVWAWSGIDVILIGAAPALWALATGQLNHDQSGWLLPLQAVLASGVLAGYLTLATSGPRITPWITRYAARG